MSRLNTLTVIGILAAMLIGTIHAFVDTLLESKRAYRGLAPREP